MSLMVVLGLIAFWLISSIKILNEYERAVIFRLGRMLPEAKGPGIIFAFFPIDRVVVTSLRLITLDVPPQDIITKDNVSAEVNAVAYFKVMDPNKAVNEVENFQYATSQMAQTTLRSVLGEMELDDLLSRREEINDKIQEILDKQTDPWGIKITNVEIKHVDINENLRRAMARQAEAERERRAKVIAAEGEFEASTRLVEAAKKMEETSTALQLRYLQTLVEIGSENNTTTLFPIPIDLLQGLKNLGAKNNQ